MSFNDADTWRTAHDDGRTRVTVSDRALALMALDQEVERLRDRKATLYAEIEQIRTRETVLHLAMKSVLKDGVYVMEGL